MTWLAARFPLPWSAYVRLLAVKHEDARAFYETEALRAGWSVRQLDRQIQSQFSCARKDDALARYALGNLPNKVLAAEYRTVLPDEKLIAADLQKTRRILERRGLTEGGKR